MKRKLTYAILAAAPLFALVVYSANSYETEAVQFASASIGGWAVGVLFFIVFMLTKPKKK